MTTDRTTTVRLFSRGVMRALLVHNRSAGDAVASSRELRMMLARAGFEVRLRASGGAWEKALPDGIELVIAAGGDGTAAKVAKGVAGTGIPFAILPFGTANNLAKTLGVIGDTADIVASWRHARPRPFDIGIVASGARKRRFVEAAGAGLFAELVRDGRRAVASARIVGRETDRALHLLADLAAEATPRPWTVTVDGVDHSGSYVGVEVMNCRFAGPNVPIALEAQSGDGWLDVVLIDAAGRDRIVAYVDDRLTTATGTLDGLRVVRGRAVTVQPPAGIDGRIDDTIVRIPKRLDVTIDPGASLVVA